MNKTLEAIGQAIFKHWFVDFEFPNKEGKPYKSSGGEMVDSEMRTIPKGWKIGKLRDLGKIVTGKTPPTAHKEYYGGKFLFLKIPSMNCIFPLDTELKLTEEGLAQIRNLLLPKNSLSVSCIGSLGLVTINKTPLVTNQNINSIILVNGEYLYYIYFDGKRRYKSILESFGGGSIFGSVSKEKFSNIQLIIPSENVISVFNRTVNVLFEKIYLNCLENQNLSQVRDLLLPRLISGKIRVPLST
jgi:type I restriction enzyme S subunit